MISVNGRPMAARCPFLPVPTPGRFKGAIHFSDDAFTPSGTPTSPFDRLIGAQALALHGAVITNNEALKQLGVAVFW